MAPYGRAWALSLVMVCGLAVAGCGFNPAEAPADAPTKDFCSAYLRLTSVGPATSAGDMAAYLEELAHFGTPRGIPAAARKGFEYVIDPAHAFANGQGFTDLATQKDTAGLNAAALKAYYTQAC